MLALQSTISHPSKPETPKQPTYTPKLMEGSVAATAQYSIAASTSVPERTIDASDLDVNYFTS